MREKYKEEDLLKIIRKEADVMEIAHKYGSSYQAVRKALYRYGYRAHRKVKIISPYRDDIYVADAQKCAEELKVSKITIYRALRGQKVAMFDELNIKVEYAEDDDYED